MLTTARSARSQGRAGGRAPVGALNVPDDLRVDHIAVGFGQHVAGIGEMPGVRTGDQAGQPRNRPLRHIGRQAARHQ